MLNYQVAWNCGKPDFQYFENIEDALAFMNGELLKKALEEEHPYFDVWLFEFSYTGKDDWVEIELEQDINGLLKVKKCTK